MGTVRTGSLVSLWIFSLWSRHLSQFYGVLPELDN